MTYNFDPDRWYEIELRAIYAKFMVGLSTQEAYERSIIELDQKLENMWKRLDGTYLISK